MAKDTYAAMSMTVARLRSNRMKFLFEVIREIVVLAAFPLTIPLHDNSHVLSSLVKITLEEYALPIKDQDVRRIQQSGYSSVVKDSHSNEQSQFHIIRVFGRRAYRKPSHSD